MILYHGSNMPIETIDLAKSKRAKDFGQGFYLSADKHQAIKMAKLTTFRTGKGGPTVTEFEFDECHLKDNAIKVKIFEEYTEEWADFILKNRSNNSDKPIHPFDIVIGPIADDTVGMQLRRYFQGYIDIRALIKELSYTKGLTTQYFFGTEKAVKLLKRTK